MNISQRVKNWGGLASAVVAIILVGDKVAEYWPDSMTPASVEYVDESVSPIDQLSLSDASKGISWGNKQMASDESEYPPEYVHEALCGNRARNIEGYYRTYERVTGAKHPAEGSKCK